MRWTTGISFDAQPERAAGAALEAARQALGAAPDLTLLFSTSPFAGPGPGPPATGGPVLGFAPRALWSPHRGWVQAPAMLALCATLPGVDLQPLHFRSGILPGPDRSPAAWRDLLGLDPACRALLLFATFHSAHLAPLMPGLHCALPGVPVGGAVAARGGHQRSAGHLLMAGRVPAVDAVGLSLRGDLKVRVDTFPCYRHLSPPRRLTACSPGEVIELEGRPVAATLLAELGPQLAGSARERELMVEVGSAPPAADGSMPDALARTLVLVGNRARVLAPEPLRPGQWLRFCMPDPEEAARRAEELAATVAGQPPARGALLITCGGARTKKRGSDPAAYLTRALAPAPCAAILTAAQLAGGPNSPPRILGQSATLIRFG